MTEPENFAERIAVLEDELAAVRIDNARLRRLLSEEGMPDSLRHAFRDTVAMLQTIMRWTADSARDVEDYNAHLTGRLAAFTRARAQTEVFGEAELHRLIAETLDVYLVRVGEQATLDGPIVQLCPKAAEVFALALHELATNAVEHGALGGPEGGVTVSWQVEDGAMLSLEWREVGMTDPPSFPRHGFGTTVLREMVPYNLGAQVDLTPELDGLSCRIRFPLTARSGRAVIGGEGGTPMTAQGS